MTTDNEIMQQEAQAMRTLYASFSAGNTDRLNDAVTADWRDIRSGWGRGPDRTASSRC